MIKVTISYVISGTYALNLFFFFSFLYGKTSSKLDLKQLFSFYIPFRPKVFSIRCSEERTFKYIVCVV